MMTRSLGWTKPAQPFVKLLQGVGVARDIAPVSEKHVEVDQVGKNETLLSFPPQLLDPLHSIAVGSGRKRFGDTATSENIADFPHAQDRDLPFA